MMKEIKPNLILALMIALAVLCLRAELLPVPRKVELRSACPPDLWRGTLPARPLCGGGNVPKATPKASFVLRPSAYFEKMQDGLASADTNQAPPSADDMAILKSELADYITQRDRSLEAFLFIWQLFFDPLDYGPPDDIVIKLEEGEINWAKLETVLTALGKPEDYTYDYQHQLVIARRDFPAARAAMEKIADEYGKKYPTIIRYTKYYSIKLSGATGRNAENTIELVLKKIFSARPILVVQNYRPINITVLFPALDAYYALSARYRTQNVAYGGLMVSLLNIRLDKAETIGMLKAENERLKGLMAGYDDAALSSVLRPRAADERGFTARVDEIRARIAELDLDRRFAPFDIEASSPVIEYMMTLSKAEQAVAARVLFDLSYDPERGSCKRNHLIIGDILVLCRDHRQHFTPLFADIIYECMRDRDTDRCNTYRNAILELCGKAGSMDNVKYQESLPGELARRYGVDAAISASSSAYYMPEKVPLDPAGRARMTGFWHARQYWVEIIKPDGDYRTVGYIEWSNVGEPGAVMLYIDIWDEENRRQGIGELIVRWAAKTVGPGGIVGFLDPIREPQLRFLWKCAGKGILKAVYTGRLSEYLAGRPGYDHLERFGDLSMAYICRADGPGIPDALTRPDGNPVYAFAYVSTAGGIKAETQIWQNI